MRTQQDALAQPRIRQVDDEVAVDVVAPDIAIDEALGERERRRVGDGGVEVRSDVGKSTYRRPQVLQVLHQVGSGVVDQSGGGVAERPELVERRRDPRPLPDENIQRRRNLLQRLGDHVALAGQRTGEPIQCLDRRHQVVALLVECADESVQAHQQITNITGTPG